ncbi:MAG: hypothetical protein ACI9GH_000028 [Candidatus Paceibacteria bacterium]|jgi:hypothetical protein
MDIKSKTLFLIVLILIVISIVFTYKSNFIDKDFEVFESEPYDEELLEEEL